MYTIGPINYLVWSPVIVVVADVMGGATTLRDK